MNWCLPKSKYFPLNRRVRNCFKFTKSGVLPHPLLSTVQNVGGSFIIHTVNTKPSIGWGCSKFMVFKTANLHILSTVVQFSSFVDHLCYLCLVFVTLSRLFFAALWSPAGKGLAYWLSFVMFNCFLSLSNVMSWVKCGTLLYRFLIFATFLTLYFVVIIFYFYFDY